MKKLNLRLDSLRVSSFATITDGKQIRGTVNGHLDQSGFCTPICGFDLGQHTCMCPCEPEIQPYQTSGM